MYQYQIWRRMKMKKNQFLIVAFAVVALCFSSCSKKGINYYNTDSEYIEENVPLERNGVSLNLNCVYSKKGLSNSKNILLIHGLTFSSHEFNLDVADYSLVKFFASKGYGAWILDITGYGLSGKNVDGALVDCNYAAEDILEAVKKICSKTGAEKIDILGWSMGTVMVTHFAESHGNLINKMVLYAPILAGLRERIITDSYCLPLWRHAVSDFQKTHDSEIDYNIAEREVVLTYISNCWKYDGKGSPSGIRKELFSGTETSLISTEKLGTVPTYIIYGENDEYIRKDIMKNIKPTEMLKIKSIPGASHIMLIEKPFYKEFQKSILTFLES